MRFFRKPSSAVLMVCTANICRSPMAEGVLRAELTRRGLHREILVDSAGTHAGQPGRSADQRAQKLCGQEGIDLRRSRARQVKERDFARFDHILAMDGSNYQWLLEKCPDGYESRISLLGSWAANGGIDDILDPYYGDLAGFERVLSMLHEAIDGFMQQIVP